ncbi:hypothetical protein [Paenarthrobacter sp. PH39-S1]|uniref:hypothetical protein n=1 Tax=Paenarthrobacter sp. PH39-S1 TaxID=3046204 RepID=UPI0024BB7731|nr:hypothetical protein [Paenarthrobacter sp. PH39-S1]MDJ0357240.1 hypothetical protein [Paenarthrobacter sp. PH39-S1]
MLDGYKSGVITEKRLHDALKRNLGLKASLDLHRTSRDELVASPEALALVGSAKHRAVAAAIADKTVTLVKDTANNLPITPATHRRIRLYGISGGSDFTRSDPLAYLDLVKEELESAGFEVHVFRAAAQREADGETGVNFVSIISEEGTGDYAEIRRGLCLRKCERFCAGVGHPDQMVDPDGRGDPLVCHRGPHRLRLAEPAQPSDRRTDGRVAPAGAPATGMAAARFARR